MTPSFYMLCRVLVKPFYRQNAGLFLFLLTIMFGVVGELDGADMLEYHYALIRGAIGNPLFLFLVMLLWFFYAQKCARFITKSLAKPELSFLSNLSLLPSGVLYRQLLGVQVLLFLPVGLYAGVVSAVAFYRHACVAAIVVLCFVVFASVASAWWYLLRVQHPGSRGRLPAFFRFAAGPVSTGYSILLFRYLLGSQKLLLAGLSFYTCGVLCVILLNITGPDYDIRLPFMFYLFGILGHSVVLYQLRHFEEEHLAFYRGLPVPLATRFARYAGVCALILLPEFGTMLLLLPSYLKLQDAVLLAASGYTLLLFLYTLLFLESYTMLDYLKGCFVLLLVGYMALMAHLLWPLTALLACLSVFFFLRGYYRFEGS